MTQLMKITFNFNFSRIPQTFDDLWFEGYMRFGKRSPIACLCLLSHRGLLEETKENKAPASKQQAVSAHHLSQREHSRLHADFDFLLMGSTERAKKRIYLPLPYAHLLSPVAGL